MLGMYGKRITKESRLLNGYNKYMTKLKMYCPETMGTFKMMFGFAQPTPYIKDNRTKIKKRDYDRKKKIQEHQVGFKTTD